MLLLIVCSRCLLWLSVQNLKNEVFKIRKFFFSVEMVQTPRFYLCGMAWMVW